MTVIDKAAWPRREHYEFFAPMSNPFYSLTFPVDVTTLKSYTKRNKLSFYYSLVYLVTKAMDQVEAFRYKCRGEEIVLHDHLIPSFTDLKPGSELFHITTLEAGEDMAGFCRRAGEASRAQTAFITAGPWPGDQLIYFTCQPWFPITSLTNERDLNPEDSVPRVAWGKYEEKDGRLVLSMSLELNHRLVDGVHVGQFYQRLNALMEALG